MILKSLRSPCSLIKIVSGDEFHSWISHHLLCLVHIRSLHIDIKDFSQRKTNFLVLETHFSINGDTAVCPWPAPQSWQEHERLWRSPRSLKASRPAWPPRRDLTLGGSSCRWLRWELWLRPHWCPRTNSSSSTVFSMSLESPFSKIYSHEFQTTHELHS